VTLAQAAARTAGVSQRLRQAGTGGAAPIGAEGTGIFLVEASTPDISSSEIRQRLAAGRSIDDVVPAPVARYIHTQRLYDWNDSNDPNGSPSVKDLHGKAQRLHR
jgi:nicotinic acid mononucleotide adenylyltransferase